MTKPNIRLEQENAILRKVSVCAGELRRIGRLCEMAEDGVKEYWEKNPDAPRSLTSILMARQCYSDALKAFDEAALEAALFFSKSEPNFSSSISPKLAVVDDCGSALKRGE